MNNPQPPPPGNREIPVISVIHVGRVSPQGVTRQAGDGVERNVGLRCANPTYTAVLGTLIYHKKGFAFKSKDYLEKGIPVIRVSNFSGDSISSDDVKFVSTEIAQANEDVRLHEHDVVIATVGSWPSNPASVVGRTISVPQWANNALMNQNSVIIRARSNSKVDQKFIYYQLKAERFSHHLVSKAQGSANQASITLDAIFSYEINWPDKKLRRAITELLVALDDRIALLRDTNTTLEAIAQALFKSWFVDFDPVRAKQEGREPEGMDAATAALFPSEFEDSELGNTPSVGRVSPTGALFSAPLRGITRQIRDEASAGNVGLRCANPTYRLGLVPRGWQWSTVDKSFKLTMGQSPPGDTYNATGDGLPFYQGRTDFGFRFPTRRIFCNAPTRIAEPGDTLVSVRAPVGDVNMALEKCCLGRGVAGVRHPGDHHSFVFYSVGSLRRHFEHYDGEGTIFGSINKKDFQGLPVITPAQPVLDAFDDIVSPIDSRIQNNEKKLQTLATLRDTLLPRLISGQLRLPDAEALVEEAAA